MAKTINFTYEDKQYTLEFNRSTIMALERGGFKIADIESKPMSTLPKLFFGAFEVHHSGVKQSKREEIYEHMTNKSDLIEKLALMYQDVLESLVDEPDENDSKNIQWGADW